MKKLSELALAIRPSSTMAIDTMFKQMKAEGRDVIGFAAGEPDFATPDHIKQAGIAAIENNETRYTPAVGTMELRQAIAGRLEADFGLTYAPAEIAVSNGAKICVYASLRALVNPGDEVILPAPYWVSYIEMIRMVGGVPMVIEAGEEQSFKITPAQLSAAVTARTKCIILNNPSNPTGMVYNREELAAIARICVERDIYIISDEVYCNLIYDGAKFTSVAALGEEVKSRTLLVNGVSKSYAMTGWRIGYVAAPAPVSKVIGSYLSHCTGSPGTISQRAAVTALTASQETVETMRQAFEQRRNYMVQRLGRMDGVSCIRPEGAFYVMMNVERLLGRVLYGVAIDTSEDFCRLFLEKCGVAVVPGEGFGFPGFVRWAYAASMEHIEEGMNRLERFLAGQAE